MMPGLARQAADAVAEQRQRQQRRRSRRRSSARAVRASRAPSRAPASSTRARRGAARARSRAGAATRARRRPTHDVLGRARVVSEMSFSAIGMKPPGFASAAPAPTTAITGESDTLLIWSIMLPCVCGSRGRRSTRDVQTSSEQRRDDVEDRDPGLRARRLDDAAASPSTNAAMHPIPIVASSAPR